MLMLRQLLEVLRDVQAEPFPEAADLVCPNRMELLDGQNVLRAGVLYLGGDQAGALLSHATAEPGALVLLAESATACVPAGATLIRVTCSLAGLHNRVAAVLFEHAILPAAEENRFSSCWDSIMEHRLTGTEEIRHALSELRHPVSTFVSVATVGFRESEAAPDVAGELLAQLQALLPDTNMAFYRNELVLLHSYPERQFSLHLPNEAAVAAALESCDAFLCLSNGTRNLSTLPVLYGLARQTLVLARQVAKDRNKRIYTVDEYSVYNIIDLCAQRYMELHRSDDIIYLIHPAVIHLTRYDRRHNTNLRDVLFYYLLNDRNLVRTAADTYMHRNTVINKVNKIQELLNLDLGDGYLRQRLIFSCQVILYYEKVMHLELKL